MFSENNAPSTVVFKKKYSVFAKLDNIKRQVYYRDKDIESLMRAIASRFTLQEKFSLEYGEIDDPVSFDSDEDVEELKDNEMEDKTLRILIQGAFSGKGKQE